MGKRIGLYTGTFDVVTNGHLDIIARSAKLFDILYVGIFDNAKKNPLFSLVERQDMLTKLISQYGNAKVIVHESELTVHVAETLGASALVRSIRNVQDLAYESEMCFFNQQMTGIETVVLLANPELQYISSSRIKELAAMGMDISKWVPELVSDELEKKLDRK
ncbi:MAG: pantetheine-phosphate adenylyltransferase [Lactococcus plantarum]|nr:pantetheine-phosphate adenylyltransferase [Lactococcus plantarum]MDN6084458.1 pantetheine-phosphate adenylyltransferase [Lactococcus plantarum]